MLILYKKFFHFVLACVGDSCYQLTMQTEAQKEASRKYKAANREKIKARNAAYRAANQDKIKSIREEYRANPEVKKHEVEYTKQWIAKHPEAHRKHSLDSYYRAKEKKS